MRERRLRLVLEYDGTRFAGFQRQPEQRTVQGCLETALGRLCGHPVAVTGAGRTDAGVHALGQVVHFDTRGRIPADRLEEAIGSLTGPEVAARDMEETEAGFHARFSAVRRTYHYYLTRERPTPFSAPFRTYDRRLRADAAERMREALRPLCGTHDFASFRAAGSEERDTVRTIFAAGVSERGAELRIELTADAFLRSMVRVIAGLLIEIGQGREEPDALRRALEARSRRAAAVTAPPQGLFLASVEYPDGYPARLCPERLREIWI